jgi:hypothetical protein
VRARSRRRRGSSGGRAARRTRAPLRHARRQAYLHALAALARGQIAEDRAAQAIQTLTGLLAMDPRDPIPVRGDLLLLLLATGRDDEAQELVDRFPEEGASAEWSFARALLRRRRALDEAAVERATAALDRAVERFPDLARSLAGLPSTGPRRGASDGADPVLRSAVEDTEGATEWLRARIALAEGRAAPPPPPTSDPEADRRFSAREHVAEAADEQGGRRDRSRAGPSSSGPTAPRPGACSRRSCARRGARPPPAQAVAAGRHALAATRGAAVAARRGETPAPRARREPHRGAARRTAQAGPRRGARCSPRIPTTSSARDRASSPVGSRSPRRRRRAPPAARAEDASRLGLAPSPRAPARGRAGPMSFALGEPPWSHPGGALPPGGPHPPAAPARGERRRRPGEGRPPGHPRGLGGDQGPSRGSAHQGRPPRHQGRPPGPGRPYVTYCGDRECGGGRVGGRGGGRAVKAPVRLPAPSRSRVRAPPERTYFRLAAPHPGSPVRDFIPRTLGSDRRPPRRRASGRRRRRSRRVGSIVVPTELVALPDGAGARHEARRAPADRADVPSSWRRIARRRSGWSTRARTRCTGSWSSAPPSAGWS